MCFGFSIGARFGAEVGPRAVRVRIVVSDVVRVVYDCVCVCGLRSAVRLDRCHVTSTRRFRGERRVSAQWKGVVRGVCDFFWCAGCVVACIVRLCLWRDSRLCSPSGSVSCHVDAALSTRVAHVCAVVKDFERCVLSFSDVVVALFVLCVWCETRMCSPSGFLSCDVVVSILRTAQVMWM